MTHYIYAWIVSLFREVQDIRNHSITALYAKIWPEIRNNEDSQKNENKCNIMCDSCKTKKMGKYSVSIVLYGVFCFRLSSIFVNVDTTLENTYHASVSKNIITIIVLIFY